MKGQKQAVIDLVKAYIPNFVPNKDIALVMLSRNDLETIKREVGRGIADGLIEYSKDTTDQVEVTSYARSMVMNHLKKAKELNGNQVYTTNPAMVQSRKEERALSKVNLDLLPEDLKTFVKTLV